MAETQNSTTLSFSFSFILLFAQLCTALFFFFSRFLQAAFELVGAFSALLELFLKYTFFFSVFFISLP